MNDPTNVHTLPARRRDDPANGVFNLAPEVAALFPQSSGSGLSARSTPAFAIPVLPPLPFADDSNDEPFADALLAKARADRTKRNLVAAAQAAQRAVDADKLRNRELQQARNEGFDLGEQAGYMHGWYWGMAFGSLLGGCLVALALKAGWWWAAR